MTGSFDFSLPEAPPRRGGRALKAVSFLVSIGTLAVVLLLYLRGPEATSGEPKVARGDATIDPARIAKAAEELERRTLYREAAETWREYGEKAALTPTQAYETLFRRARNLVEAGEWSEAVRLLTQYEALDVSAESRRKAQSLIGECLSALGKEEAREYVVRASTTPRGDSEEPQLILARVGGDAITLEELRERIALGYREMIRAERPELPAIEIANRAKELAREALTKPDALRGLVLDTVRTEILYREALESGFGTDAETRTAVEMFRRRLLAERLLASRMQATVQALTPVDYRNHYDANPDRWIEKAKVEFSYAAFPNEPAAKEAIANGVGELTPASGPAREGDPLPGIGRSAEATAHLLALEEGALGDRPIQIGDRWYVFRAEKRHARRKKTFEEAIEEVRADLLQVKEREALSRLEAELSLEFRVWLDEEAIANATKGATEAPPAGDSSKPGGPSDGANASGGASTQDATGAGS